MEQETVEAAAEVAETVILSTYDKFGVSAQILFAGMFIGLLLYRCGRAFHQYIYTGEFMRFVKSSAFGTLVDEHPEHLVPAFFTGTNPFGIMIDAVFMTLIALAMPFAWGVIVPLTLIIVLAYVMRQRIAKKQDFVSKLDGSHPDMDDHGTSGMTQSYTGGGSGNA